jgi:hypothetical protein
MSEIEISLARLRKLIDFKAKDALFEELRNRAIQKAEEARAHYEDYLKSGRAAEATKAMDNKIDVFQRLGDQLTKAEPIVRRMDSEIPEITRRIMDTKDRTIDEFLDRSLRYLDNLNSLFERELVELDDLISRFVAGPKPS